MHTAVHTLDDVATIVRWVARIIALLIAGVVVIFVTGKGLPQEMTSSEIILAITFGLMWLGLIAAWVSDKWGGILITGGTLLYLILDYLFYGAVLRFWLYGVFLIPGALLLLCWWREKHPLESAERPSSP